MEARKIILEEEEQIQNVPNRASTSSETTHQIPQQEQPPPSSSSTASSGGRMSENLGPTSDGSSRSSGATTTSSSGRELGNTNSGSTSSSGTGSSSIAASVSSSSRSKRKPVEQEDDYALLQRVYKAHQEIAEFYVGEEDVEIESGLYEYSSEHESRIARQRERHEEVGIFLRQRMRNFDTNHTNKNTYSEQGAADTRPPRKEAEHQIREQRMRSQEERRWRKRSRKTSIQSLLKPNINPIVTTLLHIVPQVVHNRHQHGRKILVI